MLDPRTIIHTNDIANLAKVDRNLRVSIYGRKEIE